MDISMITLKFWLLACSSDGWMDKGFDSCIHIRIYSSMIHR